MGEAIKMKKRTYWTTETFKERMKEVNSNIEVLGEYVNTKRKIKCKCKIDEYIWYPHPADLLHGSSCPKCYGNIKKTNQDFLDELKKVNENIEPLEEYINSVTKILVKCKIDNYEWYTTPHSLLKGQGCPMCSHKVVNIETNSIASKRPDLIKYFNDKNDAYISFPYSSKKYHMHCPYCGYKKYMTNAQLTSQGFSCPICGDGISYPNKFARCFLQQLPIDNLIFEYSPKWIGNKRYDNYFEYNGKSYILEMDGSFHYKYNSISGQTLEESNNIDKYKDDMAYKHNIKVIRINCEKSKKEYIKNNILKSELNILFDLSDIDWNKCDIFASKTIMFDICNYYTNIDKNLINIANYFNISRSTVLIYLKRGAELGWCDYDSEKIVKIMYEPMIAKDSLGNIIAKAENVFDMISLLNIIYPNIIFKKQCIRDVCKGKHHTHRNLIFEYVS